MQDRQLYAQILGIQAPWQVERVELKLEAGAVHIYLEHHQEASWQCPECGQTAPLYDHQEERQWRHLDTCQYQTILHARPPRIQCQQHGVRVVRLPWAGPSSRFTLLFERLVIDWLKLASQRAVAEQLKLSWDTIHALMHRAVKRGLQRRKQEALRFLGVDEKAFQKGHHYFTLVNDLDRGCVLFVSEGRNQASLDGFWQNLNSDQKSGIQAVAMDMWDPYVTSVEQNLENAATKIVFDKFHIASHLSEAVDKVRRQENQQLRKEGDNRLVGTKYDWLRHPGHFSREAWNGFRKLQESALKTARAWALKELGMGLFNYHYLGVAQRYFRQWYSWAIRCRLNPMVEVAKMLKRRLANILTYLKFRITNAASESINAKIQWVKYSARGFRNKNNFITAIYFHCGGLNLVP